MKCQAICRSGGKAGKHCAYEASYVQLGKKVCGHHYDDKIDKEILSILTELRIDPDVVSRPIRAKVPEPILLRCEGVYKSGAHAGMQCDKPSKIVENGQHLCGLHATNKKLRSTDNITIINIIL